MSRPRADPRPPAPPYTRRVVLRPGIPPARADAGTPRGAVFLPFCYHEAAANLLTNPVLDPFGKIPEFKYCAVRVIAGGTLAERTGYGRVET